MVSQGFMQLYLKDNVMDLVAKLVESAVKIKEESRSAFSSDVRDLESSTDTICVTTENIRWIFIIWFIGATSAFFTFLIEILHKRIKFHESIKNEVIALSTRTDSES